MHNDDTSGDIAKTIIFGINAIDRYSDGCMFFTSDQPWLTSSTIERLIGQFYNEPEKIHIPVCQEQSGNPVIFPKRFFADLCSLPPHYGGKHLVKKYPEAVSYPTVTNALELKDVDTKRIYRLFPPKVNDDSPKIIPPHFHKPLCLKTPA